jgi:hypothetical protein
MKFHAIKIKTRNEKSLLSIIALMPNYISDIAFFNLVNGRDLTVMA